jgi:hypothetical protein
MTATEATIIEAANKVATGAKATTMLKFQSSVVKCLHIIIKTAFTAEQVDQILGPDGAKVWVSWTGPTFFGDFAIDVDSTTARSNDPEVQKAEALQVTEMMVKTGGNVQLAVTEWLKAMGKKNPERYAPPAIMPGMMPPPGAGPNQGPPKPPGPPQK